MKTAIEDILKSELGSRADAVGVNRPGFEGLVSEARRRKSRRSLQVGAVALICVVGMAFGIASQRQESFTVAAAGPAAERSNASQPKGMPRGSVVIGEVPAGYAVVLATVADVDHAPQLGQLFRASAGTGPQDRMFVVEVGEVAEPGAGFGGLRVDIRGTVGYLATGKSGELEIVWLERGRVITAATLTMPREELIAAVDDLVWAANEALEGFEPDTSSELVAEDGVPADGTGLMPVHEFILSDGDQEIYVTATPGLSHPTLLRNRLRGQPDQDGNVLYWSENEVRSDLVLASSRPPMTVLVQMGVPSLGEEKLAGVATGVMEATPDQHREFWASIRQNHAGMPVLHTYDSQVGKVTIYDATTTQIACVVAQTSENCSRLTAFKSQPDPNAEASIGSNDETWATASLKLGETWIVLALSLDQELTEINVEARDKQQRPTSDIKREGDGTIQVVLPGPKATETCINAGSDSSCFVTSE